MKPRVEVARRRLQAFANLLVVPCGPNVAPSDRRCANPHVPECRLHRGRATPAGAAGAGPEGLDEMLEPLCLFSARGEAPAPGHGCASAASAIPNSAWHRECRRDAQERVTRGALGGKHSEAFAPPRPTAVSMGTGKRRDSRRDASATRIRSGVSWLLPEGANSTRRRAATGAQCPASRANRFWRCGARSPGPWPTRDQAEIVEHMQPQVTGFADVERLPPRSMNAYRPARRASDPQRGVELIGRTGPSSKAEMALSIASRLLSRHMTCQNCQRSRASGSARWRSSARGRDSASKCRGRGRSAAETVFATASPCTEPGNRAPTALAETRPSEIRSRSARCAR